MSSALMYFIFTGSNITFSGSTIAFPGMPSNLSIPSGAIQIPSISPTVNEPTSTPAPEIQTRRPDYTYTPGIGGHKLHTRAVVWNEARIICEEEGGHLAIINSIAEANAITEIFQNSEPITGSPLPYFASIGFHDLYSEGKYITIHGQTLARAGFTKWADWQPDNDKGTENCGSFKKGGGLNDINCGTRFGFICEIPIY